METIGDGVIQGGWGYVIAAYSVCWGGMLVYGISLWRRLRAGEHAPPSDHPNARTEEAS